jgi:uncharacterized CHY-type Zn-finger protein
MEMGKVIQVNGITVFGQNVDHQTRCVHWHSVLDVIAIRFKCCDRYYPCHQCHEEAAGHPAIVWTANEYDEKAILCGICGHALTIIEYKACENRCPQCTAAFNPGCERHSHLYFASGIGETNP